MRLELLAKDSLEGVGVLGADSLGEALSSVIDSEILRIAVVAVGSLAQEGLDGASSSERGHISGSGGTTGTRLRAQKGAEEGAGLSGR